MLRPDPLVVVPFSQVLRAWDASPPDVGVEGHLLKHRVLPWYLLGINTAILFGIWVTQRFLGLVILAVPCLLVITAMNIKMFKFCDRCGRSVQGGRQGASDMSKVWSGFAVTRTSRELGHRDSVADSTSSILPITF
jgi:hypothetical protein